MKKLGKLSINPERVMKNEELVSLRGGYGTACDYGIVYCYTSQGTFDYCVPTGTNCMDVCRDFPGTVFCEYFNVF